jgi:glycine betaine transporter
VLGVLLAASPYGRIKLGHDDDEPEFSTASWIAMLFAGGMGAGLLFWGTAEPIYHYYSPPGMPGETPEAARAAMVITNLHWGLHAWAIYATCALVIAYFVFRKDAPSLISTPIRFAFGHTPGINAIANVSDILGVLAVIFGLAGSLSMGTLQVRAGLAEVYGIEPTTSYSFLPSASSFRPAPVSIKGSRSSATSTWWWQSPSCCSSSLSARLDSSWRHSPRPSATTSAI